MARGEKVSNDETSSLLMWCLGAVKSKLQFMVRQSLGICSCNKYFVARALLSLISGIMASCVSRNRLSAVGCYEHDRAAENDFAAVSRCLHSS